MADGEFRIGLKVRIFNHSLKEAIKATGKTYAEVAADLGFTVSTINQYLSFKAYPNEDRRFQMAFYFGIPDDVLFPEHLQGFRITKQPETIALSRQDAESLHLLGEFTARMGDVDAITDAAEAKADVAPLLAALSARQREIVSERFGLDGNGTATYEEIARTRNVTRERVRQIEAKAFTRMRDAAKALAAAGHPQPDAQA